MAVIYLLRHAVPDRNSRFLAEVKRVAHFVHTSSRQLQGAASAAHTYAAISLLLAAGPQFRDPSLPASFRTLWPTRALKLQRAP